MGDELNSIPTKKCQLLTKTLPDLNLDTPNSNLKIGAYKLRSSTTDFFEKRK